MRDMLTRYIGAKDKLARQTLAKNKVHIRAEGACTRDRYMWGVIFIAHKPTRHVCEAYTYEEVTS